MLAKLRTVCNELKMISVNRNRTGQVENEALCQIFPNIPLMGHFSVWSLLPQYRQVHIFTTWVFTHHNCDTLTGVIPQWWNRTSRPCWEEKKLPITPAFALRTAWVGSATWDSHRLILSLSLIQIILKRGIRRIYLMLSGEFKLRFMPK